MTPRERASLRIGPGRPFPLGANWDGKGVNFALFSANAEKVELCLFDKAGAREIARVALPECTGEIWHGRLPDLLPGALYGYRVHGPYDPARGHRFNPNKLLLDPYAKALHGHILWSDAHFGYRVGSSRADLSFDRRDNARGMPKAQIVDPAFTWGDDRPPRRPWHETIIYETHLRGFTKLHPAVPEGLRGTAAGMSVRHVVDYIKALGMTAIELLPVQGFVNDRHLAARHLTNYWGYNSIAFFAPDPRFLSTGTPAEFKTLVSHLHDAGIEVILDVVYNHTGEGNELGPTLSFRGIDNASYYRLDPEQPRYYVDYTGTGNTLDLNHPQVIHLVMDSLRYWVSEMHIDGFRFDLCVALGREAQSFSPGNSFFDALRQDPILAPVKLIAEPWDLGPDGYQLANHGPGWAEWNDRFRDAARRFWRGDRGLLPELAGRLVGSADLFDRRGRRPWASVNFVTAHDGFTLADLVSYDGKHNEANGEDNKDGRDENFSANYGVEGPTDSPEINAVRRRQRRNLLATLLLSQGTPMLLAGDEFGQTQRGNNNAYCQDNDIAWLDWSRLDGDGWNEIAFVRRLAALRRRYPVLRWPHFMHGHLRANGLKDITWIAPDGKEMTPERWHDGGPACVGLMLCEDGDGTAEPEDAGASLVLVLLNAQTESVSFVLPSHPDGGEWYWMIDTVRDEASDIRHPPGQPLQLEGRSLMLLRFGAAPTHR